MLKNSRKNLILRQDYNMESLQLYLNSMSADRQYGSISWVEFTFPLIECDYHDTLYISVQSCSLPYSFYNVNQYNNLLKYSIYTTIYNVLIPTGNYTILSLLSTLQTILPTFTISYDKIKNKFTFSNASNFTFIYDTFINSTCFELIGMSNIMQNSMNGTITSDIVCNVSSVRHVCIATNFHTSNINKALPNERNILAHIPVHVMPNDVITWSNVNNYRCNLNTNRLNHIVIRILDHKGNLLDLNGVDWSLTLQIDSINYVDND